MKKLLLLVLVCIHCVCDAQSSIMRGEITPGVYGNFKTDSSGSIFNIRTPFPIILVDRSGTITTGGTAQTIMAVNAKRAYLMIQNNSDTNMWINFTTAAVQAQPSILLIPNASFTFESGPASTELVSVIGATTGKSFTAKEF